MNIEPDPRVSAKVNVVAFASLLVGVLAMNMLPGK